MVERNHKQKLHLIMVLCVLLVCSGGTELVCGSFSHHGLIAYASSQSLVGKGHLSSHVTSEGKADLPPKEASILSSNDKAKPVAASTKKTNKMVYLTFDDGPSEHTADVLDILERENIKGTFFVLGKQAERHPELLQRIVKEGHAVGNHTYDHEYKVLYGNFRHFWDQINRTGQIIKEQLGFEPVMVRAPGGTVMNFDQQYFDLMDTAGYIVYDWHVDSSDSKHSNVPAKEIIQAIKKGALLAETVVLVHDGIGHGETVKALPDIIAFYKSKGYTFHVLTPEVKPIQFEVRSTARWKHKPVSRTWIQTHVKPRYNNIYRRNAWR